MKKIFLILGFAICCISCLAQNIDNEKVAKDWDLLVNYVCCKYTEAYIKPESDKKGPALKSYETVCNSICNVSLANALSVEEVVNLLKNNGLDKQTNVVEKKFPELLKVDDANKKIPCLLSTDCYSNATKNKLESTKKQLYQELIEKYSSNNSDGEFAPNTQREQDIQTEYNTQEKKDNVCSQVSLPIWLVVLSVIGSVSFCLSLVLFVYLFGGRLDRKMGRLIDEKVRKPQECVKTSGNKEVSDLENKIFAMKADLKTLSNNIANMQKQIGQSKTPYADINIVRQSNDSTTQNPHSATVYNEVGEVQNKLDIKYVENYGNGILSECDIRHAQFVLELSSFDTGRFAFYGDMEKAVDTRDVVFDDYISEYSGYPSSKHIETVEKGEACLDGEQWKVTKKIKIKFS